MLTKSDYELNMLAATGLMHWKLKDGFLFGSKLDRKYAAHEYSPLSNTTQFEDIKDKMQARDYVFKVSEINAGEMYEVSFAKYGEIFSYVDVSIARAGTIAALLAYRQLVLDSP